MIRESGFTAEKLIIPVLLGDPAFLDELETMLTAMFGPTDTRSDIIPFEYTDYYEKEMGRNLKRVFFSFLDLVDPIDLPRIKTKTNELESELAAGGLRTVNLDPGLLSLDRFILASTKDNGRRIPLRDGIFAEITLVHHHDDFHFVEWTYPDYRSREYRDFLKSIRDIYKKQLKVK